MRLQDENERSFSPQQQSAKFRDLRFGLDFLPEKGEIRLGGHRMMMMHLDAFASFRSELLSAIGYRAARTLITRIGYVSGCRDAEWARSIRAGQSDIDMFHVGPQLHALEGIVSVETVDLRIDMEKGEHYGEFIWQNSIEDVAAQMKSEQATEAACWMQIGYASGYTTAFMGRPILYREVECQSLGARHCRIVGKPIPEWDDPGEDLSYMQSTASNLLRSDQRSSSESRGRSSRRDAARTTVATGKKAAEAVVGASSPFESALHKVAHCAPTDVSVLIEGESGAGKERFAQLIHEQSLRAQNPFISLNCAAIPENLVESELFGVERGAYTGAEKSRAGRFERAHGGTLFLDEIGLMPLQAQAKLLRVLQDGVVDRVGCSQPIQVDVRIIAATNVNLRDAVEKGEFRQDLFFRLNVFNIKLPALRHRIDDIPILIDHFLKMFSEKYNKNIPGVGPRALDVLMRYHYPGNIRELQNILERSVIMADEGAPISRATLLSANETLAERNLSEASADPAAETEIALEDIVLSSGQTLSDIEHSVMKRAVELAGGNLSEAARRLGITRPQLSYRLEKRKG